MNVLVTTDGSDLSVVAADRACDVLAAVEEITLLTVIADGDPGDDAGGIEGTVLSVEGQADLVTELAEARGERARNAAALNGGRIVEVIEAGDPADAIVVVRARDR